MRDPVLPSDRPPSPRRVAAASLAVAAIALLAYSRTLCPTVYVGDSGELAWAASSLGIAHPPGYPLWTLLGRVATMLGPGPPVRALNAASALAAAGAAGLLAALLASLTGRIAVPAGAALAFAFARGVWCQATVTEVYALNLLATSAVLAAAVAGARGRRGAFPLAAYLLGLGTGNHPFALLAAPPLAWALLREAAQPEGARGRRLAGRVAAMGALFLLGLSVYVYLPVRWSAGPEMNWGGMRSLRDVVDHVLRAQYGGLGEAAARTSAGLRLRVFAEVLGRNVPFALLAAAALGLVHLFRTRRGGAAGFVLSFLLAAGPVTALAVRYEGTFLDRSIVSVYFLPAVLGTFLAAGVGLVALEGFAARRLADRPRLALLVTGLLALLPPAVLHARNVASCDRSRSTLGERYARAMLEPLPEGSRLVLMGDNATFLAAYLQRVEGVRPDVTLCDRSLNLFVESYGEDFLALSRPERKRRAGAREVELAYALRETPIFYTEEVDLEPFGGCRFVPAGLVAQLLRPGERAAPLSHELLELPRVDREEFLEVHLAGVALYREGRWLVREGRAEEARARFHAAGEIAQGIAPILRNLGLEHLDLGDVATAEDRFREALALEPDNEDALYNLAILLARTDRAEESLALFDRLVELGADYTEVHLNRGIQLVRSGRLQEALASARRALELEPGLASARSLEEAVRRGIEIGGEAGVLEARRAVEPATAEGTLQLAARYLDRGDYERANELFREASRQAPQSLEAAYGLGYGLLRLGRPREAAAAFRRVLELDPASAAGRNALAYVFALTGDSLRTAERLAREALELDPSLAAYWNDTLGWVRYRAGDLEGALQALQASERELPPDDLSMRAENDYHLGVVLMRLGRTGEAKAYLVRSAARAQDEPWVPDLQARARQLGLPVGSS